MKSNHYFGGDHTEEKLSLVFRYLAFYCSALKNQGFRLMYIDAFAGTGNRTLKVAGRSLFSPDLPETIDQSYDGSARLSLSVEPLLHHVIFMENRSKHIASLQALQKEHPSRNIDVLDGDANDHIKRICLETHWRGSNAPGMGIRAVLFLDPYGMQVEWETLEAIKKTQAIDVWYLLPVEAVCRQAGHDYEKIDEHKRDALDRLFGSRERWERICYGQPETNDLFELVAKKTRIATPETVAASFAQEMRVAGWGYVHEPYPIMVGSRYKFALIFAVANKDGKAIGLARRVAKSILKPKH